jgi:hypothetical protein
MWKAAEEGSGERRAAIRRSQNRPAPLKQLYDEHNYGKNEQDVYKAAQRIRSDQAEKPQDQKNYEDRPEHNV